MARRNICIIGAGGFGREVYHMLDKKLFNPIGFIDIENSKDKIPIPIVGCENDMPKLMHIHNFTFSIIAIGNIKKRQVIYNKIINEPLTFPQIVGPYSQIYTNAIGEGTIVYPNVVIMNNCKIGKFSLINSGVTIGHDVKIGDFCNINPGANLAGRITIRDGSFIGIGAIIKENIKIGKNSVIGAGSVVLKDVPDNVVVYGVPARIRRKV